MKKVLLLVAALCTAGSMSAQYYSVEATDIGINPGAINNDAEQTPAFMMANSTGYTQILNAGDVDWSAMQSIPFSFEFNGSAVSSYYVAPSGVVTFSSSPGTAPTSSNTALPTSDIPEMSVCAWGINLGTTASNDGVIVKTFGTSPRRQHWIIFSSASHANITGWSYWGVVLEESTNHIYVVDMRTYDPGANNVEVTIGVQIDSTEAYSVGSAIGSNNTATGGAGSDPSDNTYYLMGQGSQPSNEIDNIAVTNAYYVSVNTATNIEGMIVNHGSSTLTSAQISYSIDGGSAVTDNLSGLSVASGEKYEFTLPTAWTPVDLGVAEIETEVVTSNGSSESITVNNTAMGEVLVSPTPVQRKPLLEQFTSSTCPPCTPGNANVLSVLANYTDQYSKINYQMSWPGTGDPYYTLEGADRRTFYGVNSVPSMHTDGSVGLNSNNFASSTMDDALNVPSFLNLDIDANIQKHIEYEMQDGQLVKVDEEYVLTASVMGSPIIEMDEGQIAHISIQENLTYDNVKTNGETEFHDVMKKMLPDAFGTELEAVASEDTFNFTETYTFAMDYRLPTDANDPIDHSIEHSIEEWDDLHAVTWVQDPNTGEVWQSENTPVVMLDSTSNVTVDTVDGQVVYTVDEVEYVMFGDKFSPLSVEATTADLISVFPNPVQNMLNISGVTGQTNVTIYDAMGRTVLNTVVTGRSIDVSGLESGVYNVVIENNGAMKMEKVTVVH